MKAGRPRIHKARKGVTRQAVSIAAKRADWAANPAVCPRDGRPRATKRLKTGQLKTLRYCAECLAYDRLRKSKI